MKQASLLTLVSLALAVSGCRIPVCDSMNYCGPPYGPVGPACGPVCDAPCPDACGDPCCGVDACGDPCGGVDVCGDPCGAGGPLRWTGGILRATFRFLGFGYPCNGCGEMYWSDFHSEPPDCWDPCDACGNWTGPGATGQMDYTTGPYPSDGYAANQRPGAANRRLPAAQKAYAQNGSSSQAPRILSVTDRAATPTLAEPAPAQQAARPTPAAR